MRPRHGGRRRSSNYDVVLLDATLPGEYQLLRYLVYHTDTLVTRLALWEQVWESSSEPDSNVADVYMHYLRNKLGRDFDLIKTGWSRGWPGRSRNMFSAAFIALICRGRISPAGGGRERYSRHRLRPALLFETEGKRSGVKPGGTSAEYRENTV